jgi:hypothetical protein
MERLLRFCGVGLMVGLALAAGPAKAASYSFGNIMPADIPGDLLVLTQDLGGDNVFAGGVTFADGFYFDLVDAGTPGVSVTVQFHFENAFDAQAVVPLEINLYKRDGASYALLVSEGPGETVSFARLLATSPTAVEQYLVTIAGKAPAEATAGYSGMLTVTAVPEPSTVALLLAGLGLLGPTFRSARRPQGLSVRHR